MTVFYCPGRLQRQLLILPTIQMNLVRDSSISLQVAHSPVTDAVDALPSAGERSGVPSPRPRVIFDYIRTF